MIHVRVINERCPANHPCPAIRVCTVGALTQDGFGAPAIDATKCTKCGKCTKVCPMGALLVVRGQPVQERAA